MERTERRVREEHGGRDSLVAGENFFRVHMPKRKREGQCGGENFLHNMLEKERRKFEIHKGEERRIGEERRWRRGKIKEKLRRKSSSIAP